MGTFRFFCSALIVSVIAIGIGLISNEHLLVPRLHPSAFPKPNRNFWGNQSAADTVDTDHQSKIRSFIPFQDSSLESRESIISQYLNLWLQHQSENPFHHQPFSSKSVDYNAMGRQHGTGYGLNRDDFHDLVTYYHHSFHWSAYKSAIQSLPHYMATIQGLNIHFLRHRINEKKKTNQIEAIMLLHGWPSSFLEFHRLIEVLQSQYKSHQIDVIVPSLPGYGFSEFPMDSTGFTTAVVAEIFRELMENVLEYSKYIVVGGDWGSAITHNMAYSVVTEMENQTNQNEQKLKGILLTTPVGSPPFHDLLLLLLDRPFVHEFIARKYNVSADRVRRRFSPFWSKFVGAFWDLIGYQHEHATRPNTIGMALESSVVAHLAWIYEKYLQWSDCGGEEQYDENGQRMLSGQLGWDDVLMANQMLYLNGKVSSAIRYYSESLWLNYQYLPQIRIPERVPVGVVQYDGDAFDAGFFEKWNYDNIVMTRYHEKGGHFPSLEYPQTMYQDIVDFMEALEMEL